MAGIIANEIKTITTTHVDLIKNNVTFCDTVTVDINVMDVARCPFWHLQDLRIATYNWQLAMVNGASTPSLKCE